MLQWFICLRGGRRALVCVLANRWWIIPRGKHLHTSPSLIKKHTKNPIVHESCTIIDHRQGQSAADGRGTPAALVLLLVRQSGVCVFFFLVLFLLSLAWLSLPHHLPSDSHFKLWDHQTTGRNFSPRFNIAITLLCFSSSRLLLVEEGYLIHINFEGVHYLTNYSYYKKKKKAQNKTKENDMKSCSGIRCLFPERNLCRILKPLSVFHHNEEEKLWSSTVSGSPGEEGNRVRAWDFSFPHRGDAEQKKMRWTVMKRKAREPPAAATHLTGNQAAEARVSNKNKLLKLLDALQSLQTVTTRVEIKLPETRDVKDRSPTSRIMLTLEVVVRRVHERAHKVFQLTSEN